MELNDKCKNATQKAKPELFDAMVGMLELFEKKHGTPASDAKVEAIFKIMAGALGSEEKLGDLELYLSRV